MSKHFILSAFCLLAALQSFAQKGSISGKVLDNKKQPVADAIVIAMQNGTPKGGTTADKNGVYTIANLVPGSYDIKARGMEHRARITTYINVKADAVTPLDFELYPKSETDAKPVKVQNPQ